MNPSYQKPTRCTIYALVAPDEPDEVRYIGKATDLSKRLNAHIQEARTSSGTYRLHWINSLLQRGLRPQVLILEECEAAVWIERERYWIAHYRKLGARLTNSTGGGEGLPDLAPEVMERLRANLSKALKGKKHSPEHAAKLGAMLRVVNTGRKHTPEARANVGAASKAQWEKMTPEARAERIRRFQADRHKEPNSAETRAKIGDKHALNYIVTAPDGNETTIRNLKVFAQEHGLAETNLRRVLDGERDHYRGWRIRRPDDLPETPPPPLTLWEE